MELGGCVIGSRKSRPKLAHGFESDDKATEALRSTRWARLTTHVTYSLDRTGTLKLLQLGGKAAGGRIAGLLDRAARALLRGAIGMKIDDFPLVETLVARTRLTDLKDKGRITIEIDGGRMSPDFVEVIEPAIKLELRHRIVEIDEQLRKLGVVIV
jgi:hypothetical protein